MLRIDYIGAKWCKVCVTVKPAIEKIARDFGVEVTILDLDELGDETITKVPTLRIWEGETKVSEIVTKHVDALREQLVAKKGVTITEDF
uniref:Thioredoxin domain-containing protein n=1 Tax=viral metagenome TaxID=1070528 RepID=A0A6C0DSM7_9ZZZZ